MSVLRDRGIPERLNELIELLRKYAVQRWRTLDLGTRTNDTRTLVTRIVNGDFRGDFNALVWGPLMIELDNVSTDKADAERRVATVMTAIFKPAFDEFGALYLKGTGTTDEDSGFSPEGLEEAEASIAPKGKGLGILALVGAAFAFVPAFRKPFGG